MIFTRRFGALAARRDFNDRREVIEVDQTTTLSEAAPQQEATQFRQDAAA
ncbi:MAG TPA: hypothetical protein VK053_03725 [Jiangellaceae bacterium]|nr:hypothetical protein [Jiangellaceae bacterium]